MRKFKKVSHLIRQAVSIIGEDIRHAPLLIIGMVLSALVETAAISLLSLFVVGVADSMNMSPQGKTQILKSFSIDINNIGLTNTGIILIGVYTLRSVIIFVNKYYGMWFEKKISLRLREQLVRKYTSLSYADYVQSSSSEYIEKTSGLIDNFMQKIFLNTINLTGNILLFVAVYIFLLTQNASIVAAITVFFVSFILIWVKITNRVVAELGNKSHYKSIDVVESIQNIFRGYKEIRMIDKIDYFVEGFITNSKFQREYAMRYSLIQALPGLILPFSIVALIVCISIYLVHSPFNNLLPLIVLFSIALQRMMPTTMGIADSFLSYNYGGYAIPLLFENLQREEVIVGNDVSADIEHIERISLIGISFKYPTGPRQILDNINIEINSGEFIGIMGPSGSGKSTLMNILLGLLDNYEGEMEINCRKLVKGNRLLSKHIAYIPQQLFLLNDTVRNNVAFGVDPAEIDNHRLDVAIKSAELTDTINAFPDGIDTVLGENAVRISGGETQRIALARAFYMDRNIFFFDEATSALDEYTQFQIMGQINRIRGKKTMVMISHRLNVMEKCDRIYKIVNGAIEAEGTYHQMVQS
jgi:ATP-binding cassette, subfamily B, bacterial PglK